MTSDKIWQRSDLLGTQVITRDTGKRLGVVSQLWVDVDQREVVALSLRENLLSGLVSGVPKFMMLNSIRQIGDVILVDTEDAIEDIDVGIYNSLINCEVITETGEPLGRVRGFRFNVEDGKVTSLVIAQLGLPQIPDQVISTYELPIDEIVSSGPDRLIVFEGSEERLSQLTVGVLERIGIGKPPWEKDEDDLDYMPPTIPATNQLPVGTRTAPQTPIRVQAPTEQWEEEDWGEPATPAPRQQPQQMRRQVEPEYYEDRGTWNAASGSDRYRQAEDYSDDTNYQRDSYDRVAYEEEDEDLWGTDPEPRQPLKIPEKTKSPEYEEEEY
ncbi:MAG: PRC-barrel domain-containing protein [Leptolyngbyaceae cyanobacterium bins.59]|nr:PRC-barrel domain-containing protein [Leptolyngbyaceae cyanobacterium bins.59]